MLSDPPRTMQCAWQPEAFVRAVPGMGRVSFLAEHPEPFLLVHLDAADGELGLGLASANKLGNTMEPGLPKRAPGDELAFQTAAHGQATVRRLLSEISARPTHRKPLEVDRAQVRERRYLVPICKRGADTVFMERITVGRARNNDIVLRHKTVSKFHAFWEYDKDGVLWLRDAESKNFSMLNGSLLNTDRVRIEMGARVRFGSVDGTVCSAETVWELLTDK